MRRRTFSCLFNTKRLSRRLQEKKEIAKEICSTLVVVNLVSFKIFLGFLFVC